MRWVLLGLLLQSGSQAYAITPAYSIKGDPNGYIRGWFKFLEGSGTTVENSANYHVCSDPVYSKNDFTELDGTLGGTTNPAWIALSGNTMPGLTYTRANQAHVKFLDNSASCTTGNNPWDWNGTANDTFIVSAWITLDLGPTCTDVSLGRKYTIVSKWDDVSECSYKLYLEGVDTDGGACNPTDTTWKLRAVFNDSGSTFNCATPCEVERGTTGMMSGGAVGISGDFHLMMAITSGSTSSTATLYVNGVQEGSGANSTCQDGTPIPAPVAIQDSSQDLYIGIDKAGGSDGFNKDINNIFIVQQPTTGGMDFDAFSRMFALFNFDDLLSIADVPPLSPYSIFGRLRAVTGTGGARPVADTTNKRFGSGSLSFDGIGGALSTQNGMVLVSPTVTGDVEGFIVDAWIRPTDADGGGTKEQTIVSRWLYNNDASCTDATSSVYRLFLDTTGKLNFEVYDSTSTHLQVTGSTTLNDNQWYHVAGLITGNTTQYLTADSLYVLLNDTADATPVAFANNLKTGGGTFTTGYTAILGGGAVCTGAGNGTDFFAGNIDEVREHVSDPDLGPEKINGGVVINEVNFKAAEEEIELTYFENIGSGRSINLLGYTLKSCINNSKRIQFNDACANCGGVGSKFIDPGDYVKVLVNATSTVSAVDTSCSGAATTCTWNSINGVGVNDLRGGDLPDSDALILVQAANPGTGPQFFAGTIDAVYWGSACTSFIATQDSIGHWQHGRYIDVDAITDATKSISLMTNGDNGNGLLNWIVAPATIGSANAAGTTVIDLINFIATKVSGGTHLQWETGSEFNTLAFNILRNEYPDEPKVQINSQPIAARGGVGHGRNYALFDAHAPEKNYHYWIEEIENDGTVHNYGPAQSPTSVGSKNDNGGADTGNSSAMGNITPATGSGCGHIVAGTGDRANASLSFILVLLIILTTRTHLLFKRWR